MKATKAAGTGQKRWKSSKNEYILRDLPEHAELGVASPLTGFLLRTRGIETPEDAAAFLVPDYALHIHDPFLLKGMEKAAERILSAIKKGERITIWSDYDADGIPGGVILHDLFAKIGYENFTNYIPHRHHEGFGLNIAGVEKLAEEGAKLIITVDCGIADVKEVARANELGVDVIITDHHLPGEKLPEAFAIVDPKQEGCTYPFKELCGSGVAWKLVQAILAKDRLAKNRFGIKEGWEKWLLDMVGLATLSDMVPLVGENRVLAFFGLKVLRRTPRVGLLKLSRELRLDLSHLTEDDIGFTITPRINAASRMGVPMDAFELLATTDVLEAGRLVAHLDSINSERKTLVAAISREAKKHCAEKFESEEMKRVIVLGNPDWRPALLGLVANTLVEEYNRPVFLWGREGGDGLKGSCRSGGSVNVVELMQHAADALSDFGGHKMSGGFSTTIEKVHLLDDALNSAFSKFRDELSAREVCTIDRAMKLDDVTWNTYGEIEKLAPFGLGNPKPLFMFENVEIGNVRTFGKGNLHLEMIFENSRGNPVKAIAFFTKPEDFGIELAAGKRVNLVAHIEKSVFLGRIELRLRIVDII